MYKNVIYIVTSALFFLNYVIQKTIYRGRLWDQQNNDMRVVGGRSVDVEMGRAAWGARTASWRMGFLSGPIWGFWSRRERDTVRGSQVEWLGEFRAGGRSGGPHILGTESLSGPAREARVPLVTNPCALLRSWKPSVPSAVPGERGDRVTRRFPSARVQTSPRLRAEIFFESAPRPASPRPARPRP